MNCLKLSPDRFKDFWQDKHRIWRRVIGRSKEECEAKRRALIDAGDVLEADGFFFRIIVSSKAARRET
jgi:hypothetical protein